MTSQNNSIYVVGNTVQIIGYFEPMRSTRITIPDEHLFSDLKNNENNKKKTKKVESSSSEEIVIPQKRVQK